MKTQKGLLVLATVSLLGLSVACNDRYAEGVTAGKAQGYTEGYDVGYDDGYQDGDVAGFERAKTYFASSTYNQGFADGKTSGIAIGYTQGYAVGKTDGVAIGYTQGYNVGYDDGYDDGDLDGYDAGYSVGYDDGYDDGQLDGYDLGYDDGFADGYDVGYDDGFADGFALSVGPTKSLRGYSNLISMVHNDLFDYSKIKAPKQTSRGLVANGKLILAETSLTNKDTLKRAAAVEQYLVVEMSKQVAKLGLSAERSLKIAKAANHFRKFSSKAALTAEDTKAYAMEMTGLNIEAMTDASSMSSAIEKAAAKNGTTPEKMSEIVAKLFL